MLFACCREHESQAEICGAHDGAVYSLSWHPLGVLLACVRVCVCARVSSCVCFHCWMSHWSVRAGHILASSSHDHATRFWTRNRPGDDCHDKYNANQVCLLFPLRFPFVFSPFSLRFRNLLFIFVFTIESRRFSACFVFHVFLFFVVSSAA